MRNFMLKLEKGEGMSKKTKIPSAMNKEQDPIEVDRNSAAAEMLKL